MAILFIHLYILPMNNEFLEPFLFRRRWPINNRKFKSHTYIYGTIYVCKMCIGISVISDLPQHPVPISRVFQ